MKPRTNILIYLIVLAVVDTVIPAPIAVLMLIYVLLRKPDWFKEAVLEVYRRG